jgi:hypothetical protein
VVRAPDVSPIVDVTGVQTYTVNQARVVFVHPRASAKPPPPGASAGCGVCRRALREGCSYCSLACKVVALVGEGRLGAAALGGGSPTAAAAAAAGGACCSSGASGGGGGGGGAAAPGGSASGALGDAGASAAGRAARWPGKRDSESSCQTEVETVSGVWRRKQASPRRSPYS